jgi:hypothetical protein
VLLLVKLRELARKKQAFRAGVSVRGAEALLTIEIKVDELVDAARMHGITEVDDFLRCDLFERSNFKFDRGRGVITRGF